MLRSSLEIITSINYTLEPNRIQKTNDFFRTIFVQNS